MFSFLLYEQGNELKNDYQLFYLFKVSNLKQNYDYSVSDSYSDSDCDFSSASMNLVIFVFFILYLHFSEQTCKPADNFSILYITLLYYIKIFKKMLKIKKN